MSVDAIRHVFDDGTPIPWRVQLLLLALAWRTPRGTDSTVPTSHADLAKLIHYSPRSIYRLLAEALELGAVEVVWAKPGHPSRYRINRGEWHVPRSEIARALDLDQGVQPELDPVENPVNPARSETNSQDDPTRSEADRLKSRANPTRSETGNRSDQDEQALRVLRDIRGADDDSSRVVDRRLAALTARVTERWGLE